MKRLVDKFHEAQKMRDGGSEIRITEYTQTITEAQLSTYSVPSIEVRVGDKLLKLVPLGTFFIGSKGRADLVGPAGKVNFMLKIKAESHEKDDLEVEDWTWVIWTEPFTEPPVEATPENIYKAMMQVAGEQG